MNVAILQNKDYKAPSVFLPENLLREARRQKCLEECNIPKICILDPDGDLANYLLITGKAKENLSWACYHSKLYDFELEGFLVGIIPTVVGAPYAVLVAEQLFVSGCDFLISVTSAGIVNKPTESKKFALITESIRDEGTSYHYLSGDKPSVISSLLLHKLDKHENPVWFNAKSWTTDAPYRETKTAINAMKRKNINCVEMESSALYAFAEAKNKNVICFAHLTNTMAQKEGDFEKGEYFGSIDTLNLLKQIFTIITF